MKILIAFLIYVFTSCALHAEIITVAPEYEDRYQNILEELRCLVCQNQTLADSGSELATDLRVEVKEMLEQGSTDKEILKFMSDRYGDFVLYKPPVKPRTWLLWFGPFLLLIGGIVIALTVIRKRAVADAFAALDEKEKQRLNDLLDQENQKKNDDGKG